MAAPNIYDVGDSIRTAVSFQNIAGVATDPTTITLKIQDPSGNETTLVFGVDAAVVKDAVGLYHSDVTIDENGDWYYRWEGIGALIGAAEFLFRIRESEF